MSFNTHNLEAVISSKVSNGATELELLQYKKALAQIKSGDIETVADYDSLPSSNNLNKIYYLDFEETFYTYSPGVGYVQLSSPTASLVFAGGFDCNGILGNGQQNNGNLPIVTPIQEFTSSTDWAYVEAGGRRSHGIKCNGTLWIIGGCPAGNIFDPNPFFLQKYSLATQEVTNSIWVDISSGGQGTGADVGIKTDGTLWGWGFNTCGVLGTGNVITACSSPVKEISNSTNWCKVSVTGNCWSTHAIKTDGTLWAWGFNISGQLGTNNTICYSSPVQDASSATNWCTVAHSAIRQAAAIKTDGTLWGWGSSVSGGNFSNVDTSSPLQEPLLDTTWCKVSMGAGNNADYGSAIKTDGTLWGWGRNINGELGTNGTGGGATPTQEVTSSTNWCYVSHSFGNTGAIKTDGTLWSWGCTAYGVFGIDTLCNDLSSPVQEITSSTNWSQISGGSIHFLGIKTVSL